MTGREARPQVRGKERRPARCGQAIKARAGGRAPAPGQTTPIAEDADATWYARFSSPHDERGQSCPQRDLRLPQRRAFRPPMPTSPPFSCTEIIAGRTICRHSHVAGSSHGTRPCQVRSRDAVARHPWRGVEFTTPGALAEPARPPTPLKPTAVRPADGEAPTITRLGCAFSEGSRLARPPPRPAPDLWR